MLNNNSQDRLVQSWVIHHPYRIRTSITCCSPAMRNFYFLTHATRTDKQYTALTTTDRERSF